MIEQILQGDRLLQVDQVEKARTIYQGIVELDPNNAIAVVGLAQCALADGDDRGAHELASKALTIDPENDMARRMEARLAEILTVRGEVVERPPAAGSPESREMRPIVTDDTRPATTSAAAADSAKTEAAQTATTSPAADSRTNSSITPPPAPPSNQRKSFFARLMGR